MGIRGLVRLLEPYRVALDLTAHRDDATAHGPRQSALVDDPPVEADHDSSARIPKVVVVDGPALAYHAYHRALARRSDARNAIEALPLYAEVNDIAISCLESCEEHGLRIGAIFFDGALPLRKRTTRQERLQAYLHQMISYRLDHNGVRSSGDSARCLPKDRFPFAPEVKNLFGALHVPAKLNALPALPFLVPSVIEALHASRFREITAVVPDEADTYCATYSWHCEAMILTSDSDLLAFDLGPLGSVCLLKDMELREAGGRSSLHLLCYETVSIAARFELKSLLSLAFAVDEDVHRSISESVKRARQVEAVSSQAFEDFSEPYALTDDRGPLSIQPCSPIIDPRLSEWLHSFQADPEPAPFYLPVLHEDTRRASAWTFGASTRSLAYSLATLCLSSDSRTRASEVYRKGTQIAEQAVPLLDADALAEELLRRHQAMLSLSHRIPNPLRYVAIGLASVCEQLASTGATAPSTPLLGALLLNTRPPTDWPHIHSIAQLHAELYSLRMLSQSLSHCLNPLSPSLALPVPLRDLCQKTADLLRDMPDLPTLFDPLPDVDAPLLARVVVAVQELSGQSTPPPLSLSDEEALLRSSTSTKKRERGRGKRKRKRTSGTVPSVARPVVRPSPNIYDTLMEMDM